MAKVLKVTEEPTVTPPSAMERFAIRMRPLELAALKEVASIEMAKTGYGIGPTDLIRKWTNVGLKDYLERNGMKDWLERLFPQQMKKDGGGK